MTKPETAVSTDHSDWHQRARLAMDAKTKPPGSLGRLEAVACRLSELQRTLTPRVDTARVVVFAADHGVAAQGVSAYPAEVTAQMVANIAGGGAAVSVLCRQAGASLEVVDVGVAADIETLPGVVHARVMHGSHDLSTRAAMSPAQCGQALEAGREAVRRALDDGIQLLGLGEMGIANTTSAAVLTGLMCSAEAHQVTGRGTGVAGETLAAKQALVDARLSSPRVPASDPLGCLADVGGLELAALCGAMQEAADQRLPVLVDGFIVTAAALVACALQPATREVLFFAHQSAENGHRAALSQMQVEPLLSLDMRLGEGSGAALAIPLLRAACAILCDMATFEAAGVSTGQ